MYARGPLAREEGDLDRRRNPQVLLPADSLLPLPDSSGDVYPDVTLAQSTQALSALRNSGVP